MRILPTKRGWKRLAFGLAILVAFALTANGFMAWWVEHKLQTKIAAIRAAGDPTSIADLAPKTIPADQNAAAILKRIAPRLKEFSKDHSAFNSGPDGESYADVETQGVPPTSQQIETVRKVLDKYPDIDQAIAAAAACNQYASLADFSLPPRSFIDAMIENVQKVRRVGNFVPWRMRILVADSDPNGAVERGIELLNLMQLHEAEPLLINFVLAIAMRGVAIQALHDVLAQHSVSADTHASLDRALAKLDDPQRLVRALRSDRAYCTAMTAAIGRDSLFDQTNPTWMKVMGWPVKKLCVEVLSSFDRLFALAPNPWNEVCRQLGPPGAGSPSIGDDALAVIMLPAFKLAFDANARDLAMLRALRIFNALTQYRDEHGREASGWEDLSLPKEATIDPFSGEPLKLKHTADGWIIYSVMQNGVDDGGDFTDQKDYGLAPHRATE